MTGGTKDWARMKTMKKTAILTTKIKNRDHVTAAQFETALIEEVRKAQGMNIPRNSISSVVAFCLMFESRLFGPRDPKKRTASFNAMVSGVIEDAKVERAQAELKERESTEATEAAKHKILLTGFNN